MHSVTLSLFAFAGTRANALRVFECVRVPLHAVVYVS